MGEISIQLPIQFNSDPELEDIMKRAERIWRESVSDKLEPESIEHAITSWMGGKVALLIDDIEW